MTSTHKGRAGATVGISTRRPSLATTVEVAQAADHAGLHAAWTGKFNDRS
jgi:alkanesulfonate monooxygenase SsuD/methylene tetrahydromethanopterin reductase-like flavin-dependent oxidoreductase (luciferase family)